MAIPPRIPNFLRFPNLPFPPQTPWTELLIKEELLKLCSTLDLDKLDADILKICILNMHEYMEFLHRSFPELTTKTMDVYNNEGVCIGEMANLTIDKGGMVVPTEAMDELTEFIKCFVKMWWKKWQTRIKITFTLPKDAIDSSKPPQIPQFTEEEKKEIVMAVSNVLMRYGELCCSDIIALSLFISYIKHNPKKEWTVEAKLNLRTSLTRQAKQMAYITGPLVFMKPNIKKFNAALGEFRNDDAAKNVG